jgi:hypothetical protein
MLGEGKAAESPQPKRFANSRGSYLRFTQIYVISEQTERNDMKTFSRTAEHGKGYRLLFLCLAALRSFLLAAKKLSYRRRVPPLHRKRVFFELP